LTNTRTVEVQLLNNLKAIIDVVIERKTRTQPVKISNTKSRVEEMELVNDSHKTYLLNYLQLEGDPIVLEREVINFIEIFNSFCSNQLDINKSYGFTYGENRETGFSTKIVQKNNIYSLKIATKNHEIFYSKHECKIIVSKFYKIYAKCFPKELFIAN